MKSGTKSDNISKCAFLLLDSQKGCEKLALALMDEGFALISEGETARYLARKKIPFLYLDHVVYSDKKELHPVEFVYYTRTSFRGKRVIGAGKAKRIPYSCIRFMYIPLEKYKSMLSTKASMEVSNNCIPMLKHRLRYVRDAIFSKNSPLIIVQVYRYKRIMNMIEPKGIIKKIIIEWYRAIAEVSFLTLSIKLETIQMFDRLVVHLIKGRPKKPID